MKKTLAMLGAVALTISLTACGATQSPQFSDGERPELPDGELPQFSDGERPQFNGPMDRPEEGTQPSSEGAQTQDDTEQTQP